MTQHQLNLFATLVDMLHQRAESNPNKILYRFLADGEGDERPLSYTQLEQRTRQIAVLLQQQGNVGDRALLLYPPGLDYIAAFFGCLYAGWIAVPSYPPRRNRHDVRLQAILDDAQATVVLTDSGIYDDRQRRFEHTPSLAEMHWIAVDTITNDAEEWQQPDITPEHIAFLQYTSGSTGMPKGVMLSHHNLLSNLALIYKGFELSEKSQGVSWLPPYHDMGLIGGILQPIYCHGATTLMSPFAFLQKPIRWLQALSKYEATISGAPNFAYQLCIDSIPPEQRAGLDLSRWTLAYNGAEPIRQQTMTSFAQTFAETGFKLSSFYPCYGLAEATLIVTGSQRANKPVNGRFQATALAQNKAIHTTDPVDSRLLVSSGTCLLPEQTVCIVDPETHQTCVDGQIGEIWVAGNSVSQGYWQRPIATEETFHATRDGDDTCFMRTGDLGFLQDGQLYVTGRLKELLIIRGRNHYPQDIEKTAADCHEALAPNAGAAFTIEVAGEEKLFLVHEVKRSHRRSDVTEIAPIMRQAVAEEHDLQLVGIILVQPRAIPKTSSGKTQRGQTRELYLSGNIKIIGEDVPQTSSEQTEQPPPMLKLSRESILSLPTTAAQVDVMATSVQQQLAWMLQQPADQLDRERPLTSFGLDSLLAIELKTTLEDALQIELPIASLLESPTIRQLSEQLVILLNTEAESISQEILAAANPPQRFPLSYGQQAIWYLCQLAPESPVYNIVRALQIKGDIEPEMVKQAMNTLVRRHSSLRTTCRPEAGQPIQQVTEESTLDFQFIDSRQQSAASQQSQLQAAANTPFALDENLLRVRLYQTDEQTFALLLAVHHIVTDFWSLVMLVAEFTQVYGALVQGNPVQLPAISHQYSDYVTWQNKQIDSPVGTDLRTYWQQQLQGELPTLNLPTDMPRPPIQTYAGDILRSHLPPLLGEKVAQLGRELGCTPFMTFLTAYQLLLARFSGQDEILTGTPTAGRQQHAMQHMQGYFVNPVVIRSQIEVDLNFCDLLQQVKETAVSAFAHEAYPFPLIVDALSLTHDMTHSPLFQNMFVWQKAHAVHEGLTVLALGQAGAEMQLNGLTVAPINLTQQAAQFDLTLAMAEVDGDWLTTWEYNTDLFTEATIIRMADHFETLLTAIIEQPETAVSRLPLLTESQTHDILHTFNDTAVDYPLGQCLHHLFEQQVIETPEASALQFEDKTLSYAQLNERANRLAHFLITQGIEPDDMVGVYMERSLEIVVALMAILKAGGAYVPIDPSYPVDRLQFMLEDAQVPVLLTQTHLVDDLPPHNSQTVCVDSQWAKITQYESGNPEVTLTADHLAYTIYTSGSTGKPKGAMNTHRAIINRLLWMQDAYQLDATDNILQKTPFSFDVSVWEFFWPLITGATLVVAQPGGHLDSTYLVKLIQQAKITTMHFVPSMLHIFLTEPRVADCTSLRRVICSGEALPYALTQRFFAELSSCELHNLYGPTEAAIDVSYWHCLKDDPRQLVPIGRPIANIQLYILDKYLQPAPQGVAGELHIGGVGLARGYWNRPELTKEKFIADPFAENGRLYKTGDLVRYLSDGTIHFLGRVDHQIKLRGFRIELGEIESQLTALPSVREALVVLHTVNDNDQRLLAYLVPQPKQTVDIQSIREQLHETLPDYMIPSLFVALDSFPLLSNGKVNRRVLPAPEIHHTQSKNQVLPTSQLEQKIAKVWQTVLGIAQVGIHDNFFDLGGHSLLLVQTQRRLQEVLGREISLVQFLEKPTIYGLTQLLSNKKSADEFVYQDRLPLARQQDDIAIIGLNCRFPGANTLAEFWKNLRDGIESIEVLDDEMLDQLGVPQHLRSHPNFVNAEPLLADIDQFAAFFFGYAPNQAKLMAPEQRLFLEIAWHALEHAGYSNEQYQGQIGVFAGMGMSTYLLFNLLSHPDVDPTDDSFAVMLGNDKDFLATRLSYHLNLTGPSIDVQTGCSTSLVATHLACESLLNGYCDIALAGGVSVEMPQRAGYVYQASGIASPDGHCRPFDVNGQGTVFGSGVGVVVLKRLADALADGDTIQAVIKGTAVNNDGALKLGYTAPSIHGQADVIARAQAAANVTPDTIQYIETHGTATELGDPIEVAALAKIFTSENTPDKTYLGSVKSNIGHLDAAAGIAGLIKTILSLQYKQIPPTCHYHTPNPKLELDATPFVINNQIVPWQNGHDPRRAGVSSFGIGGTNAHIILEEAPAAPPSDEVRPWQLLQLSAKTETAVATMTQNLADYLETHPDVNLADVAYTLQTGRRSFSHRRMLVCRDVTDAIETLRHGDPERVLNWVQAEQTRPVIFMFSGQGSQYVGMGQALYSSEPLFKEIVDECALIFKPLLGLDLRDLLYPLPEKEEWAAEQLSLTALTQPALFTVEYALAKLWQSWGIEPEAMIGHSIGEYVAATLASVFSLPDALRTIAKRGELMQAMPPGSLVAVSQPADAVQALLPDSLTIAVVNTPDSCVVSGADADIEALITQLEAQEVQCRRLHTSHAFHSSMMEPVVEPFIAYLQTITLNPPTAPLIANETGDWMTAEQATDPAYWAKHLRHTVQFSAGIQTLLQMADAVFLEVGPGNALSTVTKQQIGQDGSQLTYATLRHPRQQEDDRKRPLITIGQLWLAGVSVQWEQLAQHQNRHRIPLPVYPFERQRYWLDPPTEKQPRHLSVQKKAPLADWFYLPTWQHTLPPTLTQQYLIDNPAHWLIFSDDTGLGNRLEGFLRTQDQQVTVVVAGEQFTQLEASAFVINPAQVADYDALCQALKASGAWPEHIIHLWNLTDEQSTSVEPLDSAFYSLLYLTQALDKIHTQETAQLHLITNHLYAITDAELVEAEKRLVCGPAKVIPQEFNWIQTQLIDVQLPPENSWLWGELTQLLLAEFGVNPTDEAGQTIAYRGRRRWLLDYVPTPLNAADAPIPRLRPFATILITGGLGGLGLTVAEMLAEQFSARLGLLHHSAFPAREAWDSWLETEGDENRTSRRIRKLLALEAAGAEIVLVQADVTDMGSLETAVSQAEARFGPIQAVVHAAGVAGGGLIQLKTREQATSILAPKVQGTRNLESLFADRQLDFMLLFSSLTAIAGGIGQLDYCAANAFLDAFAQEMEGKRPFPVISVNWGDWAEVGMVVETEVPAIIQQWRQQQYNHAILPHEGQEALRRILHHLPAQILVAPRYLPAIMADSNKLTLSYVLNNLAQTNTPTPGNGHMVDYVAPRNKIEQQIVSIWQETLDIQQVGIYDNFFELGGNSLIGIKLINRINETFQVHVPAVSLYEQPSVNKLTELINQMQSGIQETRDTYTQQVDRGQRRRERRRKQRSKRGKV